MQYTDVGIHILFHYFAYEILQTPVRKIIVVIVLAKYNIHIITSHHAHITLTLSKWKSNDVSHELLADDSV